MQLFSRLYTSSRFTILSLVLAFSGTYFFLKTYRLSQTLSGLSTRVFDFSISLNTLFKKDVIVSNLVFIIVFSVAFITQRLIGVVLNKLTTKVKTQ